MTKKWGAIPLKHVVILVFSGAALMSRGESGKIFRISDFLPECGLFLV